MKKTSIFKVIRVVEMKINYDKEMMKIIDSFKEEGKVPSLLLHSCCAPCSSAVITRLMPYFNITIFYYNPNIEPFSEYETRKQEQIRFLNEINSENELSFLDCDYDNAEFKKIVKNLEDAPEGGARCSKCFYLRLKKTALIAKENNFDYFGTTLTVSPYKNSAKINEIGLNIEQELGIKFLVSDFKKQDGYKKSIELSRQYNLYRQNYCGCSYARKEEI